MTNGTDPIEDLIVEAALKTFLENGYEQTRMSEIALQLGISRPKLHYYFHTKERLYERVSALIVSHIAPPLQEALDSGLPFFEKVDRAAEVYIGTFEKYPQIPRYIVNEINRDLPHLIGNIKALGLPTLWESLDRTLRAEAAQGRIRQVPKSVLFVTFFSAVAYPFLSRKLLENILHNEGITFPQFLEIWRTRVVEQMKNLLEPRDDGERETSI